ncbi:transaldolase [Ectothiorhodospira variabilis]|uniref:transaldolase n=1 Tax=Ectothiorhodospira variabilis TaxID=505694 RepID=UPI001EFBF76A|nr:transaldolase [Ectothiorhodospira variabilis]MCG5498921.1 transaldolase [Ectothiorhodospira variabilis]
MTHALHQLQTAGQSPWLDAIDRTMIADGTLERLIREDGLCGITSNPAIFQKAFAAGDGYERAIESKVEQGELDPLSVYESLALKDIREAADLLAPVHARTSGADGYVSLEVSPTLAESARETYQEAHRLWKALERPNVMIKIPGTREGLEAVEDLIADGINVNVTLLFDRALYRRAAESYQRGLERRAVSGKPLNTISSVASFFISRIDTAVDATLQQRLDTRLSGENARQAKELVGQVAVANARLAYRDYLGILATPRWRALAEMGARPQRLLWASTGTKSKVMSDVHYVESLIGSQTVNTMPPETFWAFRDHGRVNSTLSEGVAKAEHALTRLSLLGIPLNSITARLRQEGIDGFKSAYAQLLETVAGKIEANTHPTTGEHPCKLA